VSNKKIPPGQKYSDGKNSPMHEIQIHNIAPYYNVDDITMKKDFCSLIKFLCHFCLTFLWIKKMSYFCKKIMVAFERYKNELEDILQKNNVVKRFYVFGSALTPQFDETTSDIDVLVETENLPPEEKGEQLIILWEDLETLFARKVDLLTENSLHNPYLIKEIVKTRKLIYDGQSKQIFI
jgi:predicted nucleotidyltransferase